MTIYNIMKQNRTCKRACKRFQVSKPTGKGRYESGQARCQTCDIWIDYKGCHLKDGSSAKKDSVGWYCNCCNYRVRMHPRNKVYKEKLRDKQDSQTVSGTNEQGYGHTLQSTDQIIDLSHFNNKRAQMMKKIGICILKQRKDNHPKKIDEYLMEEFSLPVSDIESEFDASIDEIMGFADVLDPPNKISMIAEFELIRDALGRTPTKQDIGDYSILNAAQYENEFESWEHMLEKLGYDPFYRDRIKNNNTDDKFVLDKLKKKIPRYSLQKDVNRLNVLIDKALHHIKSSKKGAYMSDLKILLGISQEMMPGVITRIVRVDGISKKEIQYEGALQDILFQYTLDVEESQYLENNVQHEPTADTVDVTKDEEDSQKEIQELYDKLWTTYNTSEPTRVLYVKYRDRVIAFDANINDFMRKKFISFQIDDKRIAGVIVQKKKIVVDFKLHISDLDDPKGLLRDISQVGSWTSGNSRMNVSDERDLEYCIEITRQCYDYVIGKNSKLPSKESKRPQVNSSQVHHDPNNEIHLLTEQMINEYAASKQNISKDIRRQLVKEFVESRSIQKIIDSNPSMSKKKIQQHVITNLRLPKNLREMENAGALHSNPECSLHIALFAVNHYNWDGDMNSQDAVTELALSISKYLYQDRNLNQAFKTRKPLSTNIMHAESIGKNKLQNEGRVVSTAVAIWIAAATLHKQFGIQRGFSNKEIIEKVNEQNLCQVNPNTIAMHVSSHCIANNKAMPDTHRKLYRVSRGRYRLYRKGDYYNRERKNGQIEPQIDELPDKYRDLRIWYNEEYCDVKKKTKSKEYLSEITKKDVTTRRDRYSEWDQRSPSYNQIMPKRGEVFTETELQTKFNIGNMSNIRPSTKNRIIVLVDSYFPDRLDGHKHIIDHKTRFITYIGQGSGDQKMTRNNKSMMMSKEYGYTMLYFNKQESGQIRFVCPVEYHSHSFGKQKNDEGILRRVIRFNLKMIV